MKHVYIGKLGNAMLYYNNCRIEQRPYISFVRVRVVSLNALGERNRIEMVKKQQNHQKAKFSSKTIGP
jgi:hypothetical protein